MRFSISIREAPPDSEEWATTWARYVNPTEERVYRALFETGSEGDSDALGRRLGISPSRVLSIIRNRLTAVGLVKVEDDGS